MNQNDVLKLLDIVYDRAIAGIQKVSPPIDELADTYLMKHTDIKSAAKSFTNRQIAKCTTSGFLTSFGGFLAMPVTIPANLASVLYVQMRMIACLAYMGGYDVKSDSVRTLIYACLAGLSQDHMAKKFGVQVGEKIARELIKKIPGSALTKINQKVGFRLVAKFGSKGLINLGKMVPIVGGAVSGGFDLVETRAIAKRAYRLFITNEVYQGKDGEKELIEVSDVTELE